MKKFSVIFSMLEFVKRIRSDGEIRFTLDKLICSLNFYDIDILSISGHCSLVELRFYPSDDEREDLTKNHIHLNVSKIEYH